VEIELDADDLRAAFGRDVTAYEIQPIDPHLRIHSVTGGVYRVRVDDDSCVIKVVRHGVDATTDGLWQSGADESHRNYWKREWLAFESGLLDALPGRLRAPRTLHTSEYDDSTCWIWMEDVEGRTGSELSLTDLDVLAYSLGTTQGAYASGRVKLPAQPWLSRNWLRGWVDVCSRFIEPLTDDERWTDPRLAPLVPLRQRVAALWSRREDLLAVSGEPPLAIAHWDFWPANLYVTPDGNAVAIDWSQVGVSGITHDLDQLTLDTVWMHVRPNESLEVLDERVLAAYIEGLLESGYPAHRADIRRWYAAAAALRYAWLGGGLPDVLADPEMVSFQEARLGHDISTIIANKARVIERAVTLGEAVLAR
jgi:Phosphotransferase enzyme family